MTESREGYMRMRTLQAIVLLLVVVMLGRLFYIQVVDDRYKEMAANNALRHEVQYPPRGEVRDRNGEYLVQSKEAYDLMVVARELPRDGFDTMRLCRIVGIEKEELIRQLDKAKTRSRVPFMVINQLPKEVKLRFDECNFRGFYTVYRTIRSYPRKIGGNLLGYVGEINAEQLRRNPEYRAGDYIGISGIESAYEEVLRGEKGVKVNEIDTYGVVKGSYRNGMYDSLPVPGKSIVCTIDARLQELAEAAALHLDLLHRLDVDHRLDGILGRIGQVGIAVRLVRREMGAERRCALHLAVDICDARLHVAAERPGRYTARKGSHGDDSQIKKYLFHNMQKIWFRSIRSPFAS